MKPGGFMNRGLLVLLVVASFALTLIVAADGRLISTADDTARQSAKRLAASRNAMTPAAHACRRPGRLRKVVIDANDAEAISRAVASGATEVADYGSYRLFVMDN